MSDRNGGKDAEPSAEIVQASVTDSIIPYELHTIFQQPQFVWNVGYTKLNISDREFSMSSIRMDFQLS